MKPGRQKRVLLFVSLMMMTALLGLAIEHPIITHGPYLVDPSDSGITVVWYTNVECVSWIEYCGGNNFRTFPTWGGIAQKAFSSHHGLIDGYSKIHRVRISGLEAGKKYKYRLVSKAVLQFKPYEVLFGDTIVSNVCQFETLSTEKELFSFGVVTDGHEHSEKLDTLYQKMVWDDVDLMFFTGDMLNWLENAAQIFDGFIDVSVNRFAKEIPLIYLRGNHETRGYYARHFMDYFPHSSGRFYYSFNHGPVHFIIMDSGEDKPDSHPVYGGLVDFDRYRDEQAEWLKKDIESESSRNASYQIVLIHFPIFTDSERHGLKDITEKWGPILNEASIDLVLSGHRHRYAHMKPVDGKNTFPIINIGTDMIVRVDVSKDRLDITVTNMNGEMLDQLSISSRR